MLIVFLHKKHPTDLYGGLTPVAAEMTKDFFIGTRVYPKEYHGYYQL
jgi:hypothetical protein